VNAEADRHLAFRHREERAIRARQRAPAEGNAEGTRAVIGMTCNTLNLVQRQTRLGGGTRNLEDGNITRDAAAFMHLFGWRACYIIGDSERAGIDAFAPQSLGGRAEIQNIASIIAIAENDAAAAMRPGCHIAYQAGGG
jgi:hypothetical protein